MGRKRNANHFYCWKEDEAPIHLAAGRANVDCLKVLLSHGASIDILDKVDMGSMYTWVIWVFNVFIGSYSQIAIHVLKMFGM